MQTKVSAESADYEENPEDRSGEEDSTDLLLLAADSLVRRKADSREAAIPLAELLAESHRTISADPRLVVRDDKTHALRCLACAHRCAFMDGTDRDRAGACGVRATVKGVLRAPFGYVARRYVRAVETNTIYHVHPGERALTFGMYGCDLRCPYCQNARISQALRDGAVGEAPTDITAQALVAEAKTAGCRVLCAAYNEPLIAAEWVHAVFTEARAAGLATAIISDGNATPEVLAYLRPVTDAFRVDLKGFDEKQYRSLGGRLSVVLDSIREAKRLGYWVEVVTLVVPGFNDDLVGLRMLTKELLAIDSSGSIPWHLNAFYPRYRMRDRQRTPLATLISAAGTAYARGMRFVYVSNVASELSELSHTRCPNPTCSEVLIHRVNYGATLHALTPNGTCARCGTPIPGVWSMPNEEGDS